MTVSAARRLLAAAVASVALLSCASSVQAAAPVLNLETLTGAQAEQMLQDGQLTSVELVRAYLARIAAINKAGPGLNAVTQINSQALQQAAQIDQERAEGIDLGPAMGLPILLKDIIDASPMYTSAGDWALRGSFAPDSGVAKELKAHGVIILGKTGLSEWANSFGSQPSGFSNLTGQVLSAIDTAEGPSGSSSGSGAAASAGLATLTIGTETSGSIISPSTMQADVGLRPTVGLVPGYGIAPIDASQDTAGPIVRNVADAARTLQSIAEYPGSDPTANQEYLDVMGQNYLGDAATGQPSGNNDIPAPPSSWKSDLPDYMAAINLNFVQGKRIGYNGTCVVPYTPGVSTCPSTASAQQLATDQAVTTLANAGAIMVSDPTVANATLSNLPSDCEPGTPATLPGTTTAITSCNWEAHATIDDYYKGIDPLSFTPTNLAAEVALDNTDPQEAEKDGNSAHLEESYSDDSTITSPNSPTLLGQYNQDWYDELLPLRKASYHTAIDVMMNCPGLGTTTNSTTTIPLPSGASLPGGGGNMTVNNGTSSCPGTVPAANAPVIAIIGSTGASSPAAGYPEMVVPFGYTTTQRRNIGIDISGGAYDEYNILGVGYVLEQNTNLRQAVGDVAPASYRCAHTVPPEPFASRGHCNPDYQSVMGVLGGTSTFLTSLPTPIDLETASASSLESLLNAGTITSQQLVDADLTRIALANAEGPAVQAIRDLNPDAIQDAISSDDQRATNGPRSPLEGIPVVIDDSIDATGMPTSGGSIALEDNLPAQDATVVANLKAAGAIVLGDTNTTELGGMFNQSIIDGTPATSNCTTASTTACMPQGYSSLGGQALLPSDTNKSPGGSSAGSVGAVSSGMAQLAVGLEAGTDAAQLIAPAANAGLVALKPTVGLVSTAGVMPVSTSQDAVGPIGQTVTDVANELSAMAPGVNYAAALKTTPHGGQKVATVADSSTTDSYASAVTELGTLGITATQETPGTATSAPSVIPYEFHQGMDQYLAATPEASSGGPSSLQAVINYYNANPVEGLKFGDSGLTNAESVDYTNSTTQSTYQSNLSTGQSQDQAVINNILNGSGGPFAAIMVPNGNALVGIADRAGYPVLTVPAGFVPENNSTGGDPNGVDFIGTAGSDATLLDLGYDFEQGANARNTGPSYMVTTANASMFSGAPSETNQSMWRCVQGSAFFSPYECNAGDLESPYSLGAITTPAEGNVGATVEPTLGLTVPSTSTSLGTFIPGVANTYTTSLAASVTSSGGNATLTVSDPGTTSPGDLVNGTFALSSPLQVAATNATTLLPVFGPLSASPLTLLSYSGPVSNDPVTVDFQQPISSTQPLRTGQYSKTVLFTLSTTSP